MASPRETIFAGPHALADLRGIDKVNRLFDNFIHYGQTVGKWKYVSTGGAEEGQVTAKQILDGTNGGNVYCEPLVYAFMELAQEATKDGPVSVKQIAHDPCILKPGYSCIDPACVGNIRSPNGTFGERNQCYFSAKHVYCQVGQNFYDPCFCTTYARRGEPIFSESLTQPNQYTYPLIAHIIVSNDDPSFMIAQDDGPTRPAGFQAAYVLVTANQLSKNQFEQLVRFFEERQKGASQKVIQNAFSNAIKTMKRSGAWK